MPLSDVVEARVFSICLVEKGMQGGKRVFDSTDEVREASPTMDSEVPDRELVWSGMFRHQDPTTLCYAIAQQGIMDPCCEFRRDL